MLLSSARTDRSTRHFSVDSWALAAGGAASSGSDDIGGGNSCVGFDDGDDDDGDGGGWQICVTPRVSSL
jgi:hypothetical protein